MKKIYCILLIFLIYTNINAKDVFIFNVNSSNYPAIKLDIMAFEDDYKLMNISNPNQINIIDNIKKMSITSINNSQNPISDFSLVALIDLNLDTNGKSNSNFAIAKKIIANISKNMVDAGLQTAICSYDYMSYLNQDFTTDIDSISFSLDSLKPSHCSYFERAFNTELTSAFPVLSISKTQKIILLITDTYSNSNIEQILNNAKEENISVYILNLGIEKSEVYEKLAFESKAFIVNAFSQKKADLLSAVMYNLVSGYRPSEINYITEYSCNNSHKCELNITNDTQKFNYEFDENNYLKPYIESKPKYIGFSAIDIGKEKTIDVKLTAQDGDIYIRNFEIIKGNDINIPPNGDKLSIVSGGNGGFLLKSGESHTVSIKYKPTNYQTDSALIYTQLMIDADACWGTEIPITAGFPSKGPIGKRTINLVYPYKNKKLFAGDSLQISWKGLLPEDMVHIAFSTDNGNKWDTIFNIYGKYDAKKSLIYHNWSVVDTSSDSCLIKIIQLWPNHLGKTLVLRHNDNVNSAFFSHDKLNKMVVTSSNDNTVKIWNSDNGQEIRVLEGHTAAVKYAEFSPDDKYIVSASEDMKAILWDVSTGSIIKEFLLNSSVTCARFSNDGKYIITSDKKGWIKVWNTSTFDLYRSKKYANQYEQFVYHFDLHPKINTRILSSNSMGKLSIWDFESNNEIASIDIKTLFNIEGIFQIQHCSFNEKGDMISATTAIPNHNVCLWSYNSTDNTTKYLYSLDTSITKEANSALFQFTDNYGEMLLISCGNNRTLIWDAINNKIHDFFQFIKPEHTAGVTTSMFNFDTKILLTASMDKTARLWNMDQNSIQVDTSEFFAIGYPELDGKKINFNYVASGFKKDTVVKAIISNTSNAKVTISDVSLTGKDVSEFLILKDNPNIGFELDSAESKTFDLRFAPNGFGDKECKINLKLQSNVPEEAFKRGDAKEVYSFDFIGNSYQQELVATEEFINFGEIELGDVFDIEKLVMIENKSPKDITISKMYIDGYSFEDFKMVETGVNKLPYLLKSGDKLPIKLRFIPHNLGRKNAQLHYTHDGQFGEAKINLYGECVKAVLDSITIAVHDLKAKPGDRVKVPIYAENAYIEKAYENIDGFSGYLKFNSSILAPIGDFDYDTIVGNWRTIRLNLPKEFDENKVLKYIEFDVGLGNDTVSPLILEHFAPLGRAKVNVKESSAKFTLNGVCIKNPDPRLLDLSGKLELLQNYPNPIINETNIYYELIEDGITKLYITDINGKLISTLSDSFQKKGRYSLKINVEDYQSGKYFYILQTPSQKLIKSFEVVK